MAEAYSKEFLSGSTNGKNIKVAAIATPGTLIHTAVTGTTNKDEMFIYATNTSAASVELTIEWGGVTSPDDLTIFTVAAKAGRKIIIPGEVMNNALVIGAFAATTNVINISGHANRITVT